VVFADPPYEHTGKRLYTHGEIDHLRLFAALAESGVEFLATYNYSERVIGWARRHDFSLARVIMKGGHHSRIPELLITRRPVWTREHRPDRSALSDSRSVVEAL
jgi:hypothetical protein